MSDSGSSLFGLLYVCLTWASRSSFVHFNFPLRASANSFLAASERFFRNCLRVLLLSFLLKSQGENGRGDKSGDRSQATEGELSRARSQGEKSGNRS